MKHLALLLAGAAALAVTAIPGHAEDNDWGHSDHIKRVLLISIDGMHAIDYQNCAHGISGVNNGAPYCPNLAALGSDGVSYVAASTSRPSDSSRPEAIVTGGTRAPWAFTTTSRMTARSIRRQRPQAMA